MMNNIIDPFKTKDYKAEYAILKKAISQYALYLSTVLDEDKDVISENIIEYLRDHKDKFKSKKAHVLRKNSYGDREQKTLSLTRLLKDVREHNYIFSPSLIAYKNSSEEESINSLATREFIANRGYYKNRRKEADKRGDIEESRKSDVMQGAFKVSNNSQSGAFSVEGTPMHCPSAHTTLTSTCRCVVSIANIINESFSSGNRFYSKPEYVLQSMVHRIEYTDLKLLETVMEEYKLVYPTPEDLMNIVEENTRRYWSSQKYMEIIREFVFSLDKLSIAAIVYIMDLKSLYSFNDEFIYKFFSDWIEIPDGGEELKPDNEPRYMLAVSKLATNDKILINKLNHYHSEVETKYFNFINVFLRANGVPPGLYDITNQIRIAGQVSDTDSSVITLHGLISKFTTDKEKAVRLAAVITYFISKILIDQNYQLSVNLNVEERNRDLLEMKNEFFFSGLVTTIMNKHYYAFIKMKEGYVYETPELLKKGVHLRNSKMAKQIRDKAEEIMNDILYAVSENKKINAAELLGSIADQERAVIQDLKNGSWGWLSSENINTKDSYAAPMSANYFHHVLWEDVFSPKYGKALELPYLGVKIGVTIGNKTKRDAWIESIEDRDLANRLSLFFKKYGRDKLTNIIVPNECLWSIGRIPEEIVSILDFREVIKLNFKSIYSTLEGAGIHMMNEDCTRLISDEH